MARTKGAVGLQRQPLELLINRREQIAQTLDKINGEIVARLGLSTALLARPANTTKAKRHSFPKLNAAAKRRQMEGIRRYHAQRRAALAAASLSQGSNDTPSEVANDTAPDWPIEGPESEGGQ